MKINVVNTNTSYQILVMSIETVNFKNKFYHFMFSDFKA